MLGKILARLMSRPAVRRPAPPSFARLQVELLESRLNPADNYWMGVDYNFTNPDNWSLHLPEESDQLYFSSVGMPGGPGIPQPPGADRNNGTEFIQGIVNGHTFPTKYAGIHLVSGYTGTVTFPFNIEFGNYEHKSGNTDAPGTNVTVTGTFIWTGGDINTCNNPGEYRLVGVPGAVIGTADFNSVLHTGSEFKFLDKIPDQAGPPTIGTTATIHGKVYLYNSVGMFVDIHGVLQLSDPQFDVLARIFGNGTNTMHIKGKVYAFGSVLTGMGVWVDRGELLVRSGGLEVTGNVQNSTYSVLVTSEYDPMGRLCIDNGQTLKATNGVRVEKGKLETGWRLGGSNSSEATIDGVLKFEMGEIRLGRDLNPNAGVDVYSNLKVTGWVKLYGGTFFAKVGVGSDRWCDCIDSDDKINCALVFTIDPVVQNGPAQKDNTWWVLSTKNGFDSDDDPAVPNGWDKRRSEDGKSLAIVKK